MTRCCYDLRWWYGGDSHNASKGKQNNESEMGIIEGIRQFYMVLSASFSYFEWVLTLLPTYNELVKLVVRWDGTAGNEPITLARHAFSHI